MYNYFVKKFFLLHLKSTLNSYRNTDYADEGPTNIQAATILYSGIGSELFSFNARE